MKNKIVYVILILLIGVVAYFGVRDLTPKGKERRYREKIANIEEAAIKYGETIEERLSSHCYEIRVNDLIKGNYIEADRKGIIFNPITNERMNDKRICITKEDGKIYAFEKKRK